MHYTRRHTLALAGSAAAGAGLSSLMPLGAAAQSLEGDTYTGDDGSAIVIHPVKHASFVMTVPGLVIYNDPVGGAGLFQGLPPPDLILITHEHPDHYEPATLSALVGQNTALLTNPAVHGMLPADLAGRATAIANGESTTVNGLLIEAIPAYNTTPDRLQYHPKGRDNGYILTVAGSRVYIAGDTEDIPEMRALEGINVAFLPMNLPYTMSVDQAADAVAAFQPGFAYPYHYKGSDTDAFPGLVADAGASTKVVLHDWYPGGDG